jgi:hypothetical protein
MRAAPTTADGLEEGLDGGFLDAMGLKGWDGRLRGVPILCSRIGRTLSGPQPGGRLNESTSQLTARSLSFAITKKIFFSFVALSRFLTAS